MYVCTLEEPCVTTPGNLFTAFALGRNAGEKTEEPHVKRYVSANGGLATSTKVRTSGVPITSAARGDDFKCRPFRKKFSPWEKMSTKTQKFLTTFSFSH